MVLKIKQFPGVCEKKNIENAWYFWLKSFCIIGWSQIGNMKHQF